MGFKFKNRIFVILVVIATWEILWVLIYYIIHFDKIYTDPPFLTMNHFFKNTSKLVSNLKVFLDYFKYNCFVIGYTIFIVLN